MTTAKWALDECDVEFKSPHENGLYCSDFDYFSAVKKQKIPAFQQHHNHRILINISYSHDMIFKSTSNSYGAHFAVIISESG